MEVSTLATAAISVFVVTELLLGWKLLNWLWLRPKKLEKLLREQGLQGNPYRLLVGDINQMLKTQNEAKSKPINLSDDIVPRVFSFNLQTLNKYDHVTNIF
ncbi:hypothetical protein L6164_022741 [Bauhinia variegata]|uniref:Uncharacterized protein n=1 Tax=Bauhinia variegata TaxID=167791 RepID=A0ACB9MI05_BAUVA|nr:hypothetical protein L6164_022741 [Bauhinia variegata]